METVNRAPSSVQAVLDSIKNPYNGENAIFTFLHCSRCIHEMPEGESPKTWARTQSGITPHGILVWCTRHDIPIVHLTPDEVQGFISQGPVCHKPGCTHGRH